MSILLQSEDVYCSDLFRQCFISCADKITDKLMVKSWDDEMYGGPATMWSIMELLKDCVIDLREDVVWKLSCILSGGKL